MTAHLIGDFTNKRRPASLACSAGPCSQAAAATTLRRLKLMGRIVRLPDTNTYVLRMRAALSRFFYTKSMTSFSGPLLAADQQPDPCRSDKSLERSLRQAECRCRRADKRVHQMPRGDLLPPPHGLEDVACHTHSGRLLTVRTPHRSAHRPA
jgi:hypothetical protein